MLPANSFSLQRQIMEHLTQSHVKFFWNFEKHEKRVRLSLSNIKEEKFYSWMSSKETHPFPPGKFSNSFYHP